MGCQPQSLILIFWFASLVWGGSLSLFKILWFLEHFCKLFWCSDCAVLNDVYLPCPHEAVLAKQCRTNPTIWSCHSAWMVRKVENWNNRPNDHTRPEIVSYRSRELGLIFLCAHLYKKIARLPIVWRAARSLLSSLVNALLDNRTEQFYGVCVLGILCTYNL